MLLVSLVSASILRVSATSRWISWRRPSKSGFEIVRTVFASSSFSSCFSSSLTWSSVFWPLESRPNVRTTVRVVVAFNFTVSVSTS